MPSAVPRPASTVVLLRATRSRFEILLLRRHDAVAFMGGAHVFPGGRVDEADRADDPSLRHRLAAVRELQEEAGITLHIAQLTPFANWVTPGSEPKRFDTWFYMAAAPSDQVAAHDGSEHSDSLWVDPAEAIEMARRGDIALPPPTWMTLRQMAGFRSVSDALTWAAVTPISRIEPRAEERGGIRVITVPGAPDVQFVLENGRWREAMP